MPIYALGERVPNIHPDAFVHPLATIIGKVTIGPFSTIWPGAVLRGDYGSITIGEQTSVQDGTVIHATAVFATILGSRCVVGHIAHLEGCTISDDVLVGSGSVVLHGAIVESDSLIGANALVTNGMKVPRGAMALGIPAQIHSDRIRPGQFAESVHNYVENGRRYKSEMRRLD